MNLKNIILLLCTLSYNTLAFGAHAQTPTNETLIAEIIKKAEEPEFIRQFHAWRKTNQTEQQNFIKKHSLQSDLVAFKYLLSIREYAKQALETGKGKSLTDFKASLAPFDTTGKLTAILSEQLDLTPQESPTDAVDTEDAAAIDEEDGNNEASSLTVPPQLQQQTEDTPEEVVEAVEAKNSTNQATSLTEETPEEGLLEEEPTEKPELTEKEKIKKAANVLRKRIERKRKNKSEGFAKEIENIVADTKTTLVNIKYQNLHPESATEKQVNGNALIETVMHPLDNRRKALALFGTPAVIVIVYDAYKTYCSSLAAHHKKLTIGEFVMDLLKNPTKNMLFTGTIYGLVAGQLIFGIKDLVSSTQG